MKIEVSIVIVSYNVEAFLKQCLFSVLKAARNLNIEVFVVDNNSIDNSVEMLKKNFPEIKLICNTENNGFAVACNQALRLACGKYALLLNPDTVIQENTLTLCRDFMDQNPKAGALGVKMIDGQGQFLPESKRSLPTPASAFYKIFGLSRLFPKSKTFGKYHLKEIDQDEVHPVEVLSGAFMFINKKVLDEIGLLDERFFMYGEDIDLSYRISQANYVNYYFPDTTIIHYKGESTKISSIHYVKTFYNAMLLFTDKHYKGKKRNLSMFLINSAIYFRAILAIIQRFFQSALLPSLDIIFIYLFYSLLITIWENYKFSGFKSYSPVLHQYYIPGFISIWLLFIYYFNGYKKNSKIKDITKGIGLGTISILAIYSLFPENYRFSRALIIIGSILTLIISILNRLIFKLIQNNGKFFAISNREKALLVADKNNGAIDNYAKHLAKEFEICHCLLIENSQSTMKSSLQKLTDILSIYKIQTIIFLLKDLEIASIIEFILKTSNHKISFKIILPESSLIIGSQSIIDLNSIPNLKINLISKPINKITKRIFDLLVLAFLLPLLPILIIKYKPASLITQSIRLIIGKLTWVSYFKTKDGHTKNLPLLSGGIYTLIEGMDERKLSESDIYEINLNYARNYKIYSDLTILLKQLIKIFKFNKS